MIKPFHIFCLQIFASFSAYNFGFNYLIMGELFSSSLIVSLYFLLNVRAFDKINVVSVFGLAALNLANLSAISIGIEHEYYVIAYSFICSIFLSIIFYIKLNERIN